MNKRVLVTKHLLIAGMLVVASMLITLAYTREWAGLDSLFLAFSLFFIFYFLPFFILTILFDQLIIAKTTSKIIRYLLGFFIGGFLLLYHFTFILKGNFDFENNYKIIVNAILISPLAVFLCERVFSNKKKQIGD